MRIELLGCVVQDFNGTAGESLLSSTSQVSYAAYSRNNAVTYNPGSGYEYWLVRSTDVSNIICENNNKLCKLGRGELAYNLFRNATFTRQVAEYFFNLTNDKFVYVGLTDYLIKNSYENTKQTFSILLGDSLWKKSSNEPNLSYERNTMLLKDGTLFDIMCSHEGLNGLCERVETGIYTDNTKQENCPSGFEINSGWCLKILQNNKTQECGKLIDSCAQQGGYVLDMQRTPFAQTIKLLLKKMKITTYNFCGSQLMTSCITQDNAFIDCSSADDLIAACIRSTDSPSILSSPSHIGDKKVRKDQFLASSFTPSNPPWMAGPGNCGFWCLHRLDVERWLQVDLKKLYKVYRITVMPVYDYCSKSSTENLALEDIDKKPIHTISKPVQIVFTSFHGEARYAPRSLIELHSDGSLRWMLKKPLIGRFVKIYFEEKQDNVDDCMSVDIHGTLWESAHSDWTQKFIEVEVTDYELITNILGIEESQCAYNCLTRYISDCSLYRVENNICQLYSFEKDNGMNQQLNVRVIKSDILKHFDENENLPILPVVQKVMVHKVPGSVILGCIENKNIMNIILLDNKTKLPWECTTACFKNGYENAVLKNNGYCWCGDVYLNTEISFTNLAASDPLNYCNVPCTNDPSVSCGGIGYSLVYQKPVQCYSGFLNHVGGSYYCMHAIKNTFDNSENSCKSDISYDELLNPLLNKNIFEFIKNWILDRILSSYLVNTTLEEFSIWAGRLDEFFVDMPNWISWKNGQIPEKDSKLCVTLSFFISGLSDSIYGTLDAVDCNFTEASYICDLGFCDSTGYCNGSKSAQEVNSDNMQDIEFVYIDSKSVSWYEAREMCLQREKDLCLSTDAVKDYKTPLIGGNFVNISNVNARVPIRDTPNDRLHFNNWNFHALWDYERSFEEDIIRNMQGVFCCGKHEETRPKFAYKYTPILSSRRKGKITLASVDFYMSLHWSANVEEMCCKDCYIASSTSEFSKATKFYKISPGLNGVPGTVSFELVSAPGYFLSYCNETLSLTAKHEWKDDKSSFWIINDYPKKDCVLYESFTEPNFYLYLNDRTVTLSPNLNDDICFNILQESHKFVVNPGLQTWQYSRDYCSMRGMDLCSSDTVCQDKKFGTDDWLPVINYENEWLHHNPFCHLHLQYHSSKPKWGLSYGICSPWDTNVETICYFKSSLHCCDAVDYTDDNIEDLPSEIAISPTAGDVIEYGYLNSVYLWGSGSGLYDVSSVSLSENECYNKMRKEGFYAYGFTSSSCTGITESEFRENLNVINETGETGMLKIVKMHYIKEESHFASIYGKSYEKSTLTQMVSEDLDSFTISIWYQDLKGSGGKFISYFTENDDDIVIQIFKLKYSNSFIINICNVEMLFDNEEKYGTDVYWHHLVVNLVKGYGIELYIDGHQLHEHGNRNVNKNCYISNGGNFTVGDARNEDLFGEEITSEFILIVDIWNYSMTEKLIKNLYLGSIQYGNIVSSYKNRSEMNENEFNIPQSFLQFSHYIQNEGISFNIHITNPGDNEFKQVVLKRNDLWSTGSEPNYFRKKCYRESNINSDYCKVLSSAQIVPSSDGSGYAIKYWDNFNSGSLYLIPVNLGNGSFGLQSSLIEPSQDELLSFYHRPDIWKIANLKEINRDNDLILFDDKTIGWKITSDSCDEILPESFTGSSVTRVHLSYLSRPCLQEIWKNEVGCTVPLFHHGSFFDTLVERWRQSASEGGLRKQHIKELMMYAYSQAKSGNLKYYKVCFGGYEIRLLRVSHQLKSTVSTSPSQSIRSGLLQYYDEYLGWGAVCSKQIVDAKFADVACRQLGYPNVELVKHAKLKNPVKVTMKNPQCFNNESILQDCGENLAMQCDWMQAVHITCGTDYRSCDEGWTSYGDNVCFSSEPLLEVKGKNFIKAANACHTKGAMLPEITSNHISEMLYIHYLKIKDVSVGVWLGSFKDRWFVSGLLHKTILPKNEECLSITAREDWEKRMCTRGGMDTICMKPMKCPKEFYGTQCEVVKCPIQDLPEIEVSCTTLDQTGLHTTCQYSCSGSSQLVGPSNRECIMSADYGPIWSGVDPVCDSGQSLDAERICEEQKACKHGSCVEVAYGIYSCICDEGYSGHNCQFLINNIGILPSINVDPCIHNACQNYGTCMSFHTNTFKCACLPGYYGKYCEKYSLILCDSKPCFNGGKCIQTGDKAFVCRCLKGFSGSTCENYLSSVVSTGCTFPFVYKNTTYETCTDDHIDKYSILGCWNTTSNLLKVITIKGHSRFLDRCFKQTLERGYSRGFATLKRNEKWSCYTSEDILLQYKRYGRSISCHSENNINGMEVYEIIHSNIGVKWCSVHNIYAGQSLKCQSKADTLLLEPDPIKKITAVTDETCFTRSAINIDFEDDEYFPIISEMLSCVHYGKLKVPTTTVNNLRNMSSIADAQPCTFPSVHENVTHYSCFHLNGSDLDYCYSGNELRTCLSNYSQHYLSCTTEFNKPGYSLTTTFGGNSIADYCIFPFSHEGQMVSTCELGWCYTDKAQIGWKLCFQNLCEHYPHPPTSIQDTNYRETVSQKSESCTNAKHLYLGRHVTQYACEQACLHYSTCAAYIFTPEYETFYLEEKVYSIHSIPATFREAEHFCSNIGGSIIDMTDETMYKFIIEALVEKNFSDFQFWIQDANCSLLTVGSYSYASKLWKENENCDDLSMYICQQNANEDIKESKLIGMVPDTLGYCFGMRKSFKLNHLQSNDIGTRRILQPWSGIKRDCVIDLDSPAHQNESFFTEPLTGRRWGLSQYKANWLGAQSACQTDGGHLAIINSIEMENYVKHLMYQEDKCDRAFIGIKDNLAEWIDGSFVRYHHFLKNQEFNADLCAVMTCNYGIHWETEPCDNENYYICEYPAILKSVKSEFYHLGRNMKAELGNDALLNVYSLLTQNIEHCMESCMKVTTVTKQCRYVLFNGTMCYYLFSISSVVLKQNSGTYDFFERKIMQDNCIQPIIKTIGSFYVSLRHNISKDHQNTIHNEENTDYCFRLSQSGGIMHINIDLTVLAKVYLIGLLGTMNGFTNSTDINSSFSVANIVYGIDEENLFGISFEISQLRLFHPLEIPIMTQFINISIVYHGIAIEGNAETICFKLEIDGCPLHSDDIDKYPHGYFPPSPTDDEDLITKDTVTVHCQD
ncbi:uncharacterized protein LOC144421998 [Styela clava]